MQVVEEIVMTSHRFQKLAGFIETELAAGSFPGAGVMVARNGERLFERYWGTYCSYTQRAKGSNGNGVWNDYGTSLRIVVRPPSGRPGGLKQM